MLIAVGWLFLISGADMWSNINPVDEKLQRRVNRIGVTLMTTGLVLWGITFYFGILIPARLI